METLWKVINLYFLGLLFALQLCNGLPINLENTTDSHTQLLTGLVAVLLTVCSIVFLAGCLCCQRRNGFKEFRDSPVVASTSSNLDHGIINPVANGEFTIFTPLSPPHHNNNVFLANQQIITRTQDDYCYGDVDVSSWFSETEKDFPRNKLKYIREIGKGWFGRVVEGTAQDISNEQKWTSVVVRILEATASSQERVVFLHDADIYRCGTHSNILQLHGRCLDTIPLLLLQEYCPQGDLKKYLLENQSDCSKLLSSEYPLVWCCQLTSALKHLHDNKLVHPDLATRNCQLTTNLLLKLGDYGFSIYQYPNDYYQGLPGVSVRWCAPETIESTSTTIKPKKLTFESNIWTLGVTMWEIFECGQQPYEEFNDDEVISKVLGTSTNIKLNRPSYPLLYTDYIYRLMQLCWTSSESRPTISQIDLMLTDLLQVYKNTSSISIEDFDKRWESFKPNSIVKTDNQQTAIDYSDITDTDSEIISTNSKPLSPSLNNLHGSLDNLLNDNEQEMESWLENVATKTGDLSYVKGLSEAMQDLDNTLALENTSSSESSHQSPNKQKLEFKLGPCSSNIEKLVETREIDSLTDSFLQQRNSSGSETEDENWKQKVERGVYTEKVRQKSRSVTDLMILTHIDYSESESETPLPSLDYRINFNKNLRYTPKNNLENISLMYGSEGSLLNIQDKNFQSELKKLQEERKDSLLFVPDECSQNLDCNDKKDDKLWDNSSHKRILQELNSTSEIKPPNQVFNVFNVTIDKFSPVHVNKVKLNEIIHFQDDRFYQVPKLSDIIQNSSKFSVFFNNSLNTKEILLKNEYLQENSDSKVSDDCFKEDTTENCLNNKLVHGNFPKNSSNTKEMFLKNENLQENSNLILTNGFQKNRTENSLSSCLDNKFVDDSITEKNGKQTLFFNDNLNENSHLKIPEENPQLINDFQKNITKSCLPSRLKNKFIDENIIENCLNDALVNGSIAENLSENSLNTIEIFQKNENLSENFDCKILEKNPELIIVNGFQENTNKVFFSCLDKKLIDDNIIEHFSENSLNAKEHSQKNDNLSDLKIHKENPELIIANDFVKNVTENYLFSKENDLKNIKLIEEKMLSLKSKKINGENDKFFNCLSQNKTDKTENKENLLENLQCIEQQLLNGNSVGTKNFVVRENLLENCDLKSSENSLFCSENSILTEKVKVNCHLEMNNSVLDNGTIEQENIEYLSKNELTETENCEKNNISNCLNGFRNNNDLKPNENCLYSTGNLQNSTKNDQNQLFTSFNGFKDDCQPKSNESEAIPTNKLVKNELNEQETENCSTKLAENEILNDVTSLSKIDCYKKNCDLKYENSKIEYKSNNEHIKEAKLYQVPKLMDIIQDNDDLMDYIIAKYDDKSSDNSLDYDELAVEENSENSQTVIEKTKDFLLNETQKVSFDLSENQTGILPNPLTHSNVFANTPFGKKSFQDINVNLQKENEFSSLNLFSNGIENEQCENKNLYSLETWDNFLGKALDDQENGFFDSFTAEPQSLLFIEENNESHQLLNQDFNNTESKNVLFIDNESLNTTFTVENDKNDTTYTIDTSLNDSWSNGGWFLHPQSTNDDVSGEMEAVSNSSYVGFNVDDEVMAAIRHELLTKLPQAQGVSSEKSHVKDEDDLDLLEKNEMFLRYNVYNTPLSPIPEESLLEDQNYIRQKSEDSDSDCWSEHCEPDIESPKLQQHRHTPSQDSCCSNDTLFNLEELVINETEQENKKDELDNEKLKIKENDGDYLNDFLTNERQASTTIKIITDDSELTTTENLLPFVVNKQVAPLPSPEDNPWKQLPASLLSFDKLSQTNTKLSPDIEMHKNNFPITEINNKIDENVYENSNCFENDIFNEADYVNIVNMENTKNSAEYLNIDDELSKSSEYGNSLIINDNGSNDDDNDVFGVLTDIRFNGPSDSQLMSTSFSESNDLNDEQDWDSGSDTRSSSSGEFIWKEGEHEESLKALRAAPQDVMDDVKPMEEIQEETSSESNGSDEEGESLEFVPSAWDKYATPTKSALRSPEKTLEKTEKKKSKGVWFKKQKYHCIYEYPREPESPILHNYDLWETQRDFSSFADWELDASDTVLPSEDDDFSQNLYQPKTRNLNLYQLSSIQDFNSSSSNLDDEFFISSSAKPFDMMMGSGVSSQFFPGNHWNKDNITPDSGVEDITPANEYLPRMKNQVESLKMLASNIVKKTTKKVEEPTMLGGLRHTRDKLKLDLPSSPNAFTTTTTNKIFNLEMDLEPPIVIREKPEFTTFGKSRFFVQHVDTPPDCDQSTKNVSFEALPYKPMQKHILIKDDYNDDNNKGKVEIVRGEASLLDSADEDSGIESSTLERKVIVE